jgi:hypothetical protein
MDKTMKTAKEALLLSTKDNLWKIHFFNLVDDYNRTKDISLFLDEPDAASDERLKALISSIVCTLCENDNIKPPAWAFKCQWLKKPWFVSGIEDLKAMAILESPIYFRRNNIWVLENFLSRA